MGRLPIFQSRHSIIVHSASQFDSHCFFPNLLLIHSSNGQKHTGIAPKQKNNTLCSLSQNYEVFLQIHHRHESILHNSADDRLGTAWYQCHKHGILRNQPTVPHEIIFGGWVAGLRSDDNILEDILQIYSKCHNNTDGLRILDEYTWLPIRVHIFVFGKQQDCSSDIGFCVPDRCRPA